MSEPFPEAWTDVLRNEVRIYGRLKPGEQAKVRDYVRVFVAEKNWEGCGGLKLTDEMKVVTAAQVAVLTLGFDGQFFDAVLSILVYPNEYVAPRSTVNFEGVIEEDSSRLGEAWYRGPVILSWTEVAASARRENRGRNVVFHEFAHQLDMLNGRSVDGTPPLGSADQYRRWMQTMNAEYRRLCDDEDEGRRSVFDPYGATSLVEFFAVATETFFERPTAMHTRHDGLFRLFKEFYKQDPTRFEAAH